MEPQELEIVRRAFAKHVMAAAEIDDLRLEAAFAAVPREEFLGPGPWPILRWRIPRPGYVVTPNADPVHLYINGVVGILPERNLNNGEPSLHAVLIAGAAPQPGEHIVHIGAGVGYYTAVMAELVGPAGAVTAIEFDPGLAERTAANFSHSPNVRTVEGDGTKVAFDPADVIYVNAGATHPAPSWLNCLKDGGRLILPLTGKGFPHGDARHGAVFRIERRGGEFSARRISSVAIFPSEGARDEATERALSAAFDNGGAERVMRLYRRDDLPAEQCWLRAPGWCLAYR